MHLLSQRPRHTTHKRRHKLDLSLAGKRRLWSDPTPVRHLQLVARTRRRRRRRRRDAQLRDAQKRAQTPEQAAATHPHKKMATLPVTSQEQVDAMLADYQSAFNGGSHDEVEGAKCRCDVVWWCGVVCGCGCWWFCWWCVCALL
jgi:hypothetical protein